jgi:hypothetical protein
MNETLDTDLMALMFRKISKAFALASSTLIKGQ